MEMNPTYLRWFRENLEEINRKFGQHHLNDLILHRVESKYSSEDLNIYSYVRFSISIDGIYWMSDRNYSYEELNNPGFKDFSGIIDFREFLKSNCFLKFFAPLLILQS